MKLETSKFYRTRGGKRAIVYNLQAGGPNPVHGAIFTIGNGFEICVWDPQGRRVNANTPHPNDIVGEWSQLPGRKIAYINTIGIVGIFDEHEVPDDVKATGTRAHWLDEPLPIETQPLGGEE